MKIQIDDIVRNATADEKDAIKLVQDEAAHIASQFEAKQEAAASARIKLKKLGLTDDEIAALTGA